MSGNIKNNLIQIIMSYHVKNLEEGSRKGNWLEHWENQTNQKAGICHKIGCYALATDGAHVKLVDSHNDNWYIVPLCHKCNCQFGESFSVEGPLVPVNSENAILP